MAERAPRTEAVAKKPLLARIKGWIGGGRAAKAPSSAPREKEARAEEPVYAPLSRATVAQWLWGDGFVSPGDGSYVIDMVKPIGLTSAASVLDLSAGIGGAARVITQTFGAYVTGLERSPERAKLGQQMSVAANLAKRATITQYNPENVELRPNSFDCVLGRGATYNVVDKERLLRVVHQALKQRGHLLFNEFMVDPEVGERPEMTAWASRESYPPTLWTLRQYTDCLKSLGFDIRITTDLTGTYRAMIVSGWARMLEEVDLRAMPKPHRLVIIEEAELWMRRIAALQSGGLRVFRVYALLNKPSV